MLKDLTTITLATGATVLALSVFAENPVAVENASEAAKGAISHSTAPIAKEKSALIATTAANVSAPVTPSSPLQKKEGTAPIAPSAPNAVSPLGSAEVAAPSGPFVEKKSEAKPSAPEKPVLSESGKSSVENVAPTKPAVATVSMGNALKTEASKSTENNKPVVTQDIEKKQENKTSNDVQKHVMPIQLNLEVKAPTQPEVPQAVVKPESPKIVEKPAEMTAPEKQAGNSNTSHASSMNMPSMNMKVPTASMGTAVTPQAVSAPSVSVQPVEKAVITPTQLPVVGH